MIKKQDAERIIEEKQRRLDELSRPEIWDRHTRHLECGELKEFKQSCIDDEIIIEALKPYATEKPLTHFDRIKAMSINELTQFLFVHQFTKCSHCAYFQKICSGNYFDDKSCTTGIKLYLESEVQGE